MRKINLLLSILFLGSNLFAQTDLNINLNSEVLQTEREIKIHLPNSYEISKEKVYPLIITLDAENTYYFTVANTEIMFDPDPDFAIIPETIIVGIKQNYPINDSPNSIIRGKDSSWDQKTGGFSKSSTNFYKFLKEELIPYLKENYRIGNFKAILGHSLTASFVSSTIIENDRIFDAYILLSPNLESFNANLFDNLESGSSKKSIYLCTSDNDLSGHRKSITELNNKFFSKKNYKNIDYKYEDFNDEHHISLINESIPSAIGHIFSYYNFTKSEPLIKEFLRSKNKKESYSEFLQTAKILYGIENNIRANDFHEIFWYIDQSKDWQQYLAISNLLFIEFPDTTHPYYARAMFEEKYNKDYEKALEYYNKGLKYLDDSYFDEESYKMDIERTKMLMKK